MTFAEQFNREIAQHEMQVIRDDGVNRHLRFKRPGTMCMHFDLITWPGYLCYTGDMGTYVFRRLHDMFEFFRRDETRGLYRIDLRYWAEKVEASDKTDGITEFNEEKFTRIVKEHVLTWVRENAHTTTREQRRELWDAVVEEVVGVDSDSGGYRKQAAAHDFTHRIDERRAFTFRDFWESDCSDYTHRFRWCCHALSWGINTYDHAKAGTPAVAA
jgi:hypothetical protein